MNICFLNDSFPKAMLLFTMGKGINHLRVTVDASFLCFKATFMQQLYGMQMLMQKNVEDLV